MSNRSDWVFPTQIADSWFVKTCAIHFLIRLPGIELHVLLHAAFRGGWAIESLRALLGGGMQWTTNNIPPLDSRVPVGTRPG